MKASVYSVESTTAETVIDLAAINQFQSNDVYLPCLFSIEVSGNDAVVTVSGIGPFPSSAEAELDSGMFAIGGETKIIDSAVLGQLIFNRTGTTAYNINIVRKPI